MKKLLFALALVLAITPLALAENQDSSYTDDASLVPTLTAEVDSETNAVTLEWSETTDEDFVYYKVLRSKDNPDMVYPDDGYHYYTSDVAVTTYVDEEHDGGTHYYRVCAIASGERRGCSETVTLELEATVDVKVSTGDSLTDDESIDITLEGELNAEGKAEFSWTEYDSDNFKWYKLVKSQDTDKPVYPTHHTVYVGEDSTVTEQTVKVPGGVTHYRVCVVTTDDTRGCSNTVTFETDGPTKEEIKDHMKAAFEDHKAHWAKKHIEALVEAGIVDGDQDNFRPNEPINRAEAIKMVVLAAGITADNCNSDIFPDLRADDWFCKVATAAYDKGYVEGDNGRLNPGTHINRAQAIKLVLVAKAVSIDAEVQADFPDVPRGAWYGPYAYKAKKLGLMEGKEVDGKRYFDPAAAITRAELAKIIDVAF